MDEAAADEATLDDATVDEAALDDAALADDATLVDDAALDADTEASVDELEAPPTAAPLDAEDCEEPPAPVTVMVALDEPPEPGGAPPIPPALPVLSPGSVPSVALAQPKNIAPAMAAPSAARTAIPRFTGHLVA